MAGDPREELETMARSTREVLQSHLDLRSDDDTEGDIAANYAEDVVLLT